MKYKYKCVFTGRLKGAIGITYEIEETVESEEELDSQQVRDKLYEKYQDIMHLKIYEL